MAEGDLLLLLKYERQAPLAWCLLLCCWLEHNNAFPQQTTVDRISNLSKYISISIHVVYLWFCDQERGSQQQAGLDCAMLGSAGWTQTELIDDVML